MTEDQDFRYLRWGWLDEERPCDNIARIAFETLPGEVLPQRWQSSSQEDFIEQFGEGVRWSKTASYHMLWVSGKPLVRIWTNAKTKTLVDVGQWLSLTLAQEGLAIVPVPQGTQKKRPELVGRTNITMPEEIVLVMEWVKRRYGVGEA